MTPPTGTSLDEQHAAACPSASDLNDPDDPRVHLISDHFDDITVMVEAIVEPTTCETAEHCRASAPWRLHVQGGPEPTETWDYCPVHLLAAFLDVLIKIQTGRLWETVDEDRDADADLAALADRVGREESRIRARNEVEHDTHRDADGKPQIQPPQWRWEGEHVVADYDYTTALVAMDEGLPGLYGCIGCFRCRADDHGSCHGCGCRCQGEYGGDKCPEACTEPHVRAEMARVAWVVDHPRPGGAT